MSKLNFKPEFALGADADAGHGAVAAESAVPASDTRAQAAQRSARRRSDTLRLRMPSDDGFHLFRIY